MPIGTSDGAFYKDFFEKQRSESSGRLYVSPLPPPPGDEQMVKTPNQMYTDKELNSQQADDELFGGTEISFKQPLESPQKPAGALNPTEGSQTPEKDLETNFLNKLVSPYNKEGKRISSEDLDTGIVETVKKSLTSMYEALKLPGDAWQGKIDPMSPQGIERANTLAGLVVLGPAPVAAKLADGTLGSFAGVKAQNIKSKLSDIGHAQILEANGVHPDEIWSKTGFMRGPDGRWRFEIDDSKAAFKQDWPEQAKASQRPEPKDPFEQVPFDPNEGMPTVKLKDALDHPELYKSYPHLKNIDLVLDPTLTQYGGYWDRNNNRIVMGPALAADKSSIMHEVQHAIQAHEGFATGGSPMVAGQEYALKYTPDVAMYADRAEHLLKKKEEGKLTFKEQLELNWMRPIFEKYAQYLQAANDKAHELYLRLSGETEARNVETRLDLSEQQRRDVSPRWTQDYDKQNQIVTQEPVGTTAYGLRDSWGNITPAKQETRIFESYSQRWANNDNARPLNEYQQFIKDYDELVKLREGLGTPVKNRYSPTGFLNRWSDLDYAKYNKAGRAFAKKHGQTWEDVHPVDLNPKTVVKSYEHPQHIEDKASEWARGNISNKEFRDYVREHGWDIDPHELQRSRKGTIDVFDPSGKMHELTP